MDTEITRIMLDLDDVCNQFTAHAMQYVGCPDLPFPVECGYDMVAAVNKRHPTKNDWTPEELWSTLGRDLWDDMPTSCIYPWILSRCRELVGRDQVFICTSLTDNIECTAGKLGWMQRTLPAWLQYQFVLTPAKEVTANPYTLLIDDSHANISRFRSAGGQTMMIPAPWNPYKRYVSTLLLDNLQTPLNLQGAS